MKGSTTICEKVCLIFKDLVTVNMKSTIPVFLLAGLLFFSCDDADEVESVNTLGTDVQLSMAEYFEPGQRTLSFKFLTQKDFPCINYRIKSEYRREGSSLMISLSEVEGADVCLEAIAPASSFLDVGELVSGEYPIVIEVGESLTNTGTLTVTEDFFGVVMNEEDGLIVQTPRILRVPQGVIWGSVRLLSQERLAMLLQNFLNQLQSLGASPKQLSEGDYGYFSVDATGAMSASSAFAGQSERMFLLDYQGETADLTRTMSEYIEDYGDEVSISLRTADGDELKSGACSSAINRAATYRHATRITSAFTPCC